MLYRAFFPLWWSEEEGGVIAESVSCFDVGAMEEQPKIEIEIPSFMYVLHGMARRKGKGGKNWALRVMVGDRGTTST